MNIYNLGIEPYFEIWQKMKAFTETRHEDTIDELWLLEHEAIFTQGQGGKEEHLLDPGPIPVIKSDRGGQITYHGPGQLVGYLLMDIKRRQLGIKKLVHHLEQTIIQVLSYFNIGAHVQCGAPGVYIGDKKIASIGLRVKKGCTYHGFSFNICMDLNPFKRINPCGFKALEMTQLSTYIPQISIQEIKKIYTKFFLSQFDSLL